MEPPLCSICGSFDDKEFICSEGDLLCGTCMFLVTRAAGSEVPCPRPECKGRMKVPDPPLDFIPKKIGGRLKKLDQKNDKVEYASVRSAFLKTMESVKKIEIYRVINPELWSMFTLCRANLEKRHGANVISSFHASTPTACGSITREGFDTSRSGSAHGTALGCGVYVADAASFSHGYSSVNVAKKRCMFYCLAALGVDGTNSKKSPGQYVLFRDCQVYPSHLIYYEGDY